MMPRLEARENTVWAERVAVGMGRLKSADHAAVQRRWRREAGHSAGAKVRTAAGLMAVLKAAGVPVRLVPRQAVTSASRRRAKRRARTS